MKNNIKKAREDTGLSRAEMARRLGIPLRTLENWEYGKRSLPDWEEKMILDKISGIQHIDLVRAHKERKSKKLLEIAREKIKNGKSEILKEWRTIVDIKDSDFLEALEWLYSDEGDEYSRKTREIALSQSGLKKIKIKRDKFGLVARFNEDGSAWEGEYLRIPLPEGDNPSMADADGKVGVVLKICLDREDKI